MNAGFSCHTNGREHWVCGERVSKATYDAVERIANDYAIAGAALGVIYSTLDDVARGKTDITTMAAGVVACEKVARTALEIIAERNAGDPGEPTMTDKPR